MKTKTSIFISNEAVLAVVGRDSGKKIYIKRCCRKEMPEGLVYNGEISDRQRLAEVLREFYSDFALGTSDVHLVLDSDAVLTGIMNVPALGEKQLRQLVRNEFPQQNTGRGELLYDYTVLRPRLQSKGGQILGAAAEKKLILQYMELFKEIGVGLSGIDIGLACAHRVCEKLPELKDATCLVSVLDGSSMVSMLFVNGIYSFSSRSRLFEPRGTYNSAVEISRMLSALLQFNISQKTEDIISRAYICGLKGDEENFCADISASLGVDILALPESLPIKSEYMRINKTSYSDYLYCIGDIINSK